MSSCRHVHLSGQIHRCKRCKHSGKREREHALEDRRICPECGLEVSRTGLYPHLKYHCPANPNKKKRTYSNKTCPICKKRVRSARFARHVKSHSKKKKWNCVQNKLRVQCKIIFKVWRLCVTQRTSTLGGESINVNQLTIYFLLRRDLLCAPQQFVL